MRPKRPRRIFIAAVWLWISTSLVLGRISFESTTPVTPARILQLAGFGAFFVVLVELIRLRSWAIWTSLAFFTLWSLQLIARYPSVLRTSPLLAPKVLLPGLVVTNVAMIWALGRSGFRKDCELFRAAADADRNFRISPKQLDKELRRVSKR